MNKLIILFACLFSISFCDYYRILQYHYPQITTWYVRRDDLNCHAGFVEFHNYDNEDKTGNLIMLYGDLEIELMKEDAQ